MKRTRLEIGNHKPERCRHVPYIVIVGPTEQVGRGILLDQLKLRHYEKATNLEKISFMFRQIAVLTQ